MDQAEVCEKFLSFNVRPVMDYFQEVINKALTKIVRIGNGTIKFPEQVICRLINESICDITRYDKLNFSLEENQIKYNGYPHLLN